MRHHTIVVTSWNEDLIEKAHNKAEEIFSWVSPLSPRKVNGYISFFIPPDGSKEGWSESVEGDINRKTFLDWCDEQAYDDGSNAIDYVECFFGDSEYESGIVRYSEQDLKDRKD